MNIALWLDRIARTQGDRPALFRGGEQVADYAQFHRAACGLAGALRAQGIRPGDRVALFMKNCPEFLIALYGIWVTGAAAVPINAKLHPKEAAYIIENAGAKLAVVTPELGLDQASDVDLLQGEAFDAACAHDPVPVLSRGKDDLAWLLYTSGTTGQPKGVRITHGMLVTMSLTYLADVDEVHGEDAAFYMAPMSHGAGLYAPVHVLHGARHICPASGGFDEVELLDAAEAQGPPVHVHGPHDGAPPD